MGRNWTQEEWSARENATRLAVKKAPGGANAWREVARGSRAVLRNFSTSFFLVTRFLPALKRRQVDVIYAAVRYPDEIVDTFRLPQKTQLQLLADVREVYLEALRSEDWPRTVEDGASPWIAGFAGIVRAHSIPPEFYLAFLDAMATDANPRTFRDINDLIDGYIYGSAIVVGYFLAYVYGASAPHEWPRMLESSRNLGIALQLTNFLRDVAEDARRGRVYLPQDFLEQEGIADLDCDDPAQIEKINRVVRRVSGIAEGYYRLAEIDLDAFAPDCRVAIQACIDVYRRLNRRIGASPLGIRHRESVPLLEKFGALPSSKFWRVPLALLGAI